MLHEVHCIHQVQTASQNLKFTVQIYCISTKLKTFFSYFFLFLYGPVYCHEAILKAVHIESQLWENDIFSYYDLLKSWTILYNF